MKGTNGKVVFVTGGENGLGAAIAKRFAKEGSQVVIFGIDEVNGEKVAAELNALCEGSIYIKGNVTKNDDLMNAMSIIKEKYGRLDFAINNAGITGVLHNFLEQSEDQFDKIMAVNVKGTFLSMQNELILMKENNFGRIVNISSEAGFSSGFKGFPVYIASKHAINGLTKSAAIEYASTGITINAIAPGTMKTPLIAAYSKEDQDMLSSIRPSKRLISVENVAESVLFMCSDYAIDAVGSILSMDGGYTVQ